jgi:hypothetical protein
VSAFGAEPFWENAANDTTIAINSMIDFFMFFYLMVMK